MGGASPKTGVTGGWSSGRGGGQNCFNKQVSSMGGDNSVDSATARWASQAQDIVGRFQKMRTKNPDCVPV